VDPVPFVEQICRDAAADPARKRTRFAKRLTPVTLFGPATETGLDEVAKKVLAPHFHAPDALSKKVIIPRETCLDSNELAHFSCSATDC
jgi:tRNA acetyltransferase TAN1